MPTISQLRDLLGLPRNTKTRQVLHRAIRLTPGGAELLDRLERLDYARYQLDNDPQFAAEVGKLRRRRDELVDAIRNGTITPSLIPSRPRDENR